MWNKEALTTIAEKFGGLLDINFLTLRRQNLDRAVIKVRGRLKGFYPTEVFIPYPEGRMAKISIAKVRVEERGTDSIQMQELLGLLGVDDQGELIDNSKGDHTKKMIGGDILPGAQIPLPRMTKDGHEDFLQDDQHVLPQENIPKVSARALPPTGERQDLHLDASDSAQVIGRNKGDVFAAQHAKAQTQGKDRAGTFLAHKDKNTPVRRNKCKMPLRVSFATGEIHNTTSPAQIETTASLYTHEGTTTETHSNRQGRDYMCLEKEIIEQQPTIERHVVSDSEESNGSEHLLEEDQLAQINSEDWEDERVLETPNSILKEREEARLRGIIETEIISITTLMVQRELLGLSSLCFEPLPLAKILPGTTQSSSENSSTQSSRPGRSTSCSPGDYLE
ncbi:hypothetical protein Sjap_022590 [Stephania japonica]|uniref:Uncharacterized protein n=1 Tax=Stephania japonica TaxID=461633 RepID=A0AAP0HQ07_9MAGN